MLSVPSFDSGSEPWQPFFESERNTCRKSTRQKRSMKSHTQYPRACRTNTGKEVNMASLTIAAVWYKLKDRSAPNKQTRRTEHPQPVMSSSNAESHPETHDAISHRDMLLCCTWKEREKRGNDTNTHGKQAKAEIKTDKYKQTEKANSHPVSLPE
jgi:hypothetical protein